MGEYELTETNERPKDPVSVSIEPVHSQHVRYLERPKSELILDFLLAIIPWLFIGLAIAAQAMKDKPVSSMGDRIGNALILGPTLFPIVFAALCGHFMKTLALYKSQTGLRMKHLEHLVGAQSIFSSFERLFFLKNYSAVGIIITLTWCLSPLGGQAFVRMLRPHPHYYDFQQNATYLTPDVLGITYLNGISGAGDALVDVETVYGAAISSPRSVRDSAQDIWGNPKIPSFTNLKGPLTENATEVNSANDTTKSYLSLIGIPVGQLMDGFQSEFEIVSLNLNVTCISNDNQTLDQFANSLSEALYNSSDPSSNTTIGWQQYIYGGQAGAPTTFLYATNNSVNNFMANVSDTIRVFYGTKITGSALNEGMMDSNQTEIIQCLVTPIRLQSNVTCQGQLCEVTAVRKLTTNLAPQYQETLVEVLLGGALPGLGNGEGLRSTPTALFLADPDLVLSVSSSGVSAQISEVSLDRLSERMSMVLNAFSYAATVSYWAVNMDTLLQDYRTSYAERVQAGEADYWFPALQNTTAQMRQPLGNKYVVYQHWFAIALVTSIILAAIALGNIVLRFMTKVPDVFGYASSLTIGNELCRENGLARSSALDGLERAAELRDVKFRIADIRSDSEVGRMAFVPVSDVAGSAQQHGDVRLGRLYD